MTPVNYDYLSEQAGAVKYTIYPTAHKISGNMKQDIVAWLRQEFETAQNKKSN
jgi:phospholipase/carboxylesterase